VAVVAIASAAYGAWWLWDGDALRVQNVSVEGAQVADARLIEQLADLDGRSLLTLDGGAAAQRVLEALPEVKAVSVRREWPQRAVIEVTEHQGWGYWQAGGRRVVVDETGRVLGRARPPAATAPTLLEIGATGAYEVGEMTDADTVALVARMLSDGTFDRLRVTPLRFEFRRDRGLTIVTADGPRAVFGDSQHFEFKVAAWGALLDRIEAERLDVSEIDLRFGNQLVMR
jgi:hypothetical protein